MAPSLLERQILRARNGLDYITGANRPRTGQSPRDLMWKRDTARLWRYRSDQRRYRPPVLIVHSLVSKSYVLDLLPNTSMVRYLIEEGFDVFLLDWVPPDPADAENTLETYVEGYLVDAIEPLLREAGAEEVTLIGYCFGGILTLLLTAGHSELPIRNLMVMATPCDYREMGFMSNMFREHRLDADDVIDETGLVPARVLDEGFQTLKPTDQLVQQVNLFENLWNDEFVEGFLAISRWARDQVPFPGAAFRQTVQVLIRENALLKGVVPFGRGEVRLTEIRCPFLNAFAEEDGITPAMSSEPLTRLVGSEDASELRLSSGHIGFVAGREAAKVARPQIADWIRAHSDEV
ncbi:MAG: alpha/beta fold hydrolase [Solirubrobacterales bacterium]|nr:alpha/beta fold hydrolase [Solirubrobacterales bacterium]